MIYRIYPSKDTFISNDYKYPSFSRLTSSNVGASEELCVFKKSGMSGGIGSISSSSLSRILLQFDLNTFKSISSSLDSNSSNTFFLKLHHKSTEKSTQPRSFDVLIKPISSSWDEGLGKDVDLGDNGFANWEKRTSLLYWSSKGGDFIESLTTSSHFDTGFEDLEVNVTNIVNEWLSGNLQNNGFAIMMTSSIEDDTSYVDYYNKKFYSRQTDSLDKKPFLEVRSKSYYNDDRANFYFSKTGSLYIHNIINGEYSSFDYNQISVDITDSSGSIIKSVPAFQTATGIYSASFSIATGSYTGSVFYDKWGSGSYSIFTGTFYINNIVPTTAIKQLQLESKIRNLKDYYTQDDFANFEVSFRRKNQNLQVFQTASLNVKKTIVQRCYYAIENDNTNERVVDFDTGPVESTRLSYNENGNSFKFNISNLSPGNVYRIIFLVYENGTRTFIDDGIKVKVV